MSALSREGLSLQGKTIAILEARLTRELEGLIIRYGGKPRAAPALQEVPLPNSEKIRAFVEALCRETFDIVIFLTGVGARALLRVAEEMGRKEALIQALRNTKVVCRGPKPVAVMREHQVPVALTAPEPHTSEDLIQALKGWDLKGKRLALQHYGEVNRNLCLALEDLGAQVQEITLYQWALPQNKTPLVELIQDIIKGVVDVVVFTSQPQVQNLFQVAQDLGLHHSLRQALGEKVVVAAVGPVVARALDQKGVPVGVIPPHPKMGSLVLSLAQYLSGRCLSSQEML